MCVCDVLPRYRHPTRRPASAVRASRRLIGPSLPSRLVHARYQTGPSVFTTLFRVSWRNASSCARSTRVLKLNPMVQYSRAELDASFAALADATRRGVLEQLGRCDASITTLAEKFHMTLTGMKKHVGVLEQAGLVTTEKVGRVRTCKLGPRRLEEETAWLERYRQLWDARFDELDKIVEELKRKEKIDGRRKRE